VPAKAPATSTFVKPLSTRMLDVGKPDPLYETEVPAGPVEGDSVTAGDVMVNVPAVTEVLASEIITV